MNLNDIFEHKVINGIEKALATAKAAVNCTMHGAYSAAHFWNGKTVKPRQCPVCATEAEMAIKRTQQAEHKRLLLANKRTRLEREMEQANIPKRFVHRTLDNYVVVNADAGKALQIAREYADNFESALANGTSLLLLGKVGNGKTHLAIGIAHEIIKRGLYPFFISVASSIRYIKESWGRDSDHTESQAIRNLVEPDLLILDEVGVQFGSDTEKLILFDILNKRYEQMKPTIVLSNLGVAGLEENLGLRVLDRLREGGGRVVSFTWESYRG